MKDKETKISISVMKLFRVIPNSGSYQMSQIAWLYNQKYPAASRPRQAVNWLIRIPLTKYRVGRLIKAELVDRTPVQAGKRQIYQYWVTPKGVQYKHDHS